MRVAACVCDSSPGVVAWLTFVIKFVMVFAMFFCLLTSQLFFLS
jgi:hypothetical protein